MLKPFLTLASMSCFISVSADIPNLPNCNSTPASQLNWSGCNKANLNLADSDLSFSDLSFTNFNQASLINANLTGSILTGANLEGVDLAKTKLDSAMWTDGRLCSTIKPQCKNRLPLNMGYTLLKDSLNIPNLPPVLKDLYRRQLRSSITYNMEKFTFLYKDAIQRFAVLNTQDEDPISLQPFTSNDQVIILKTSSGRYHAFLKDTFLSWINTSSCKFAHPLTNEALEFVINT